MISTLRACHRAAGSGAFVSWASFAVTLALSATAMNAALTAPTRALVLPSFTASLLSWGILAVALVAIALLERGLSHAWARRVIVVVAVVAASIARPAVSDALLVHLGSVPWDADDLWMRAVTNAVVWLIALSLTAVLVRAFSSRRAANALLRRVRAELEATHRRAALFDRDARTLVGEAVRSLREDVSLWQVSEDPVDLLPFLRERMRTRSRELSEWAAAPLPSEAPADPQTPRRDTVRSKADVTDTATMLRIPPIGLVAAAYTLCFLPFAMRMPAALALGAIVLVVGSILVDLLPRRLRLRLAPRARVALFLALSVAQGAAMSAAGVVGGVSGPVAFVPLLAYPAIALTASLCAASLHALRRESRLLGSAVARGVRAARLGTAATRQALIAAGAILHRDGQGACVVFQNAPTDAATLARDLDRVLQRVAGVFDDEPAVITWPAVEALLATWGRVVSVDAQVDAGARAAVDSMPAVAADAYEVVAEGMLNAVRHAQAAQIEVRLQVVATGGGPALAVAVTSPGALPPGAALRADSPAALAGAALSAGHGRVTLRAQIPLRSDAPADAVV